jgi:hypothetical protein
LSRLDELGNGFQSHLRRLNRNCSRAERLVSTGRISVGDCELIYEASFIASVGSLEHMIEAMLIEMIRMERGSAKGNRSLIFATSRATIRNIVLGGRSYVEFLPIDRAVARAGIFLSDPVPFSKLGAFEVDLMKQAMYVRNAIAHRSEHATAVFRRSVAGVNQLPPNRRHPGAYLRSVFRVQPTQTRQELYFAAMQTISRALPSLW